MDILEEKLPALEVARKGRLEKLLKEDERAKRNLELGAPSQSHTAVRQEAQVASTDDMDAPPAYSP